MKVICTLPNASELISGVRFVSHADGMISEEIADDVAARFLRITGYRAAPSPRPAAPAPAAEAKAAQPAPAAPSEAPADSGAPAAPSADDVEALRNEAAALGVKVHHRWGAARLRTEIETAKRKAANGADSSAG